MKPIRSFKEFYPFYLSQHQNPTCRTLHYIGSLTVIVALLLGILLPNKWFLIAIPFIGYGPAWVGHFFFEKNRPATFTYPFYSLAADWVMLWKFVTKRLIR